MRAAERLAAERGRTLLTLDTAEEEGASGLYEKLGFTHAGDDPGLCAEAARRADGNDDLLEAAFGVTRLNTYRLGFTPLSLDLLRNARLSRACKVLWE